MKQDKPFLSILIPTFCCVNCIRRILQVIEKQPSDSCEIIISDDSPGDEVVNYISSWKKKNAASKWDITVHHNNPSLGAVRNWNSLLDKAQGDYCLLLHHDEFPLSVNFVNKVIDVLSTDEVVDILIMDCALVDINSRRARQHAPSWLRNFIAKSFPDYLFRRNIIGPVSTLVVRRSMFPRFNEKLQWLVDVELYVRLFKQRINIKTVYDIQIGSAPDDAHSITSSLDGEISRIKQKELKYLRFI